MTNLLRACLDWPVIAALGALGLGIVVFVPSVIAAALPLLVVAACPLSMLVMMRTMGGHDPSSRRAVAGPSADRAQQIRSQLAASRREEDRLALELHALEAPAAPMVNAPASTSSR